MALQAAHTLQTTCDVGYKSVTTGSDNVTNGTHTSVQQRNVDIVLLRVTSDTPISDTHDMTVTADSDTQQSPSKSDISSHVFILHISRFQSLHVFKSDTAVSEDPTQVAALSACPRSW